MNIPDTIAQGIDPPHDPTPDDGAPTGGEGVDASGFTDTMDGPFDLHPGTDIVADFDASRDEQPLVVRHLDLPGGPDLADVPVAVPCAGGTHPPAEGRRTGLAEAFPGGVDAVALRARRRRV